MGEELRKRVEESGMSIVHFADKIEYSRQSIYRLFNQKAIHSDILARSSKVLNFNFMSLYEIKTEPDNPNMVEEDRAEYVPMPRQMEEKAPPFLINIQLDLSFQHHVKIFNDYTLGLKPKFR